MFKLYLAHLGGLELTDLLARRVFGASQFVRSLNLWLDASLTRGEVIFDVFHVDLFDRLFQNLRTELARRLFYSLSELFVDNGHLAGEELLVPLKSADFEPASLPVLSLFVSRAENLFAERKG